MKTLDELFELYCEYNKKDGKVVDSNSYPYVRRFIKYSKDVCYTEYLSQEVLDDWCMRSESENTDSFNLRMGNIRQFVFFVKRNGYASIVEPEKIHEENIIVKKSKQIDRPFETSCISDDLEEYVDWIKKSGKYTEAFHNALIRFNRELIKRFPDAKDVSFEMLSVIFAQHPNEIARSCNLRNKPAASFFEYLNWRKSLNIAIPQNLQCNNHYDRIPHAFSNEEIKEFFYLIDKIPPRKWENDRELKIRRLVAAAYFRLLYSSGMRTNEARNLKRENVDLENGVIDIENTKGYHQHRVALHESMAKILRQYDEEMEKLIPNRIPFFPNVKGEFHCISWQAKVFRDVWQKISDSDARAYDLRSNYAVRNINEWHLGEPKWIDKFMYLSRSMGHKSLTRTSYYYHLVPMFREKLEQQSGENLKRLLPNMQDFLKTD